MNPAQLTDNIEARLGRVTEAAPVTYRWTATDDMGVLIEVDVPWLLTELRASHATLDRVRELNTACSVSSWPGSSCRDDQSRTPDAEFGADRYCDPCRLARALDGTVR